MDANYLVLRGFWSFGRYLRKGEYVSADQVRSPRLRISEGKIATAVPSSPHPAANMETILPPVIEEQDIDKAATLFQELVAAQQQPVQTKEIKTNLLSFKLTKA